MPRIRASTCKRGLVTTQLIPLATSLNASSAGDVRGHNDHHDDSDQQHSTEHSHYPDSDVSRFFNNIGLLRLASTLAHSGRWTLVSISSFLLSLMLSTDLSARLLGPLLAHAAHTMALSVTFFLSGLPQTVEAACVAGSGQLDTHVLMSLAVFGTLTLGMAQEASSSILVVLPHTRRPRPIHLLFLFYKYSSSGARLGRVFPPASIHVLIRAMQAR